MFNQNQYVYMLAVFLVLVGALNWGSVGAFNLNLVSSLNNNTFKSEGFEKGVYILVALCAIYLLFYGNLFLPFLGETVLPHSVLDKNMKHSKNAKQLEVNAPESAIYVVYWSALPMDKQDGETLTPGKAYGGFSNSGVSKVVNGKAIIYFDCPVNYNVGLFNSELNKHVHYRFVYANGVMSDIMTTYVEKQC